MSLSNVSEQVERFARVIRELSNESMDHFKVRSVAGDLEKLAEPRGGVELAHVCSECGVIIEDDELETITNCPNCGQPFYEID